MTMRKLASILTVFALVVGSFVLVPSAVRAQGGAAKWTAGDYWEYTGQTFIGGITYAVILRFSVDHTEGLTIGSHSYETFNCSVVGTMSAQSVNIGILGYLNFVTSDLARARVWFQIPLLGGWVEAKYDSPVQDFQFPLSNGQTWSSTSTQIYTSSGFGNGTQVITYDYSVSGPAEYIVPAGTFNAYAMMEEPVGVAMPGEIDYSDTVGFAVRINGTALGLNMMGSFLMTQPLKLKSYAYFAGSGGTQSLLLIIVLIIVLLVVVVIAVLLLMRRRRAISPAPPAMSQYGQTEQQQMYRPPPSSPPRQ